jgi:hypothetical protein
MTEQPCFTYWVVKCKTPDCGKLLLDVVGPCDRRRVLFLERCRDFEVKCSGCMKTYTYSRIEVHEENVYRAPSGFIPDRSFQAAIRPEQQREAEASQ